MTNRLTLQYQIKARDSRTRIRESRAWIHSLASHALTWGLVVSVFGDRQTMASISLPPLRNIPPENLAALRSYPTPKIRTDADVESWKQTQGFSDYSLFLQWLNEAVVGCYLPWTNDDRSEVKQTFARRMCYLKSRLGRASAVCSAYSMN